MLLCSNNLQSHVNWLIINTSSQKYVLNLKLIKFFQSKFIQKVNYILSLKNYRIPENIL